MNKFLTGSVVVVIVLVLSGCGFGDKVTANFTGNSKHCVEGVQYIQFSRGASVMYNQDGTVKTC